MQKPPKTADLRSLTERVQLLKRTDDHHDRVSLMQLAVCRSLIEAARKEVS